MTTFYNLPNQAPARNATFDETTPFNVCRRCQGSGHEPAVSPRESELLKWLGRGLKTSEIARELKISIKTVECYRANLKRKLGLKNGNQLIVYAANHLNKLNSKATQTEAA